MQKSAVSGWKAAASDSTKGYFGISLIIMFFKKTLDITFLNSAFLRREDMQLQMLEALKTSYNLK